MARAFVVFLLLLQASLLPFSLANLPYESFEVQEECTFSLKELPVPEEAVVFGDPRYKEDCRATSYHRSKPSNMFNPNNIRLWTREEDVMARSTIPEVQEAYKASFSDPFYFQAYNALLREKQFNLSSKPVLSFLHIPKSASTSMRLTLDMDGYVRGDDEVAPRTIFSQITFSVARNPFLRLLSGMGTVGRRFGLSCRFRPNDNRRKATGEALRGQVCKDFASISYAVVAGDFSDATVSKTVDFLDKWGSSPAYFPAFFPTHQDHTHRFYFPHLLSQSFFHNLYPPAHLYGPSSSDGERESVSREKKELWEEMSGNKPFDEAYDPAVNDLDFFIRMEHIQEGLAEAAKKVPELKAKLATSEYYSLDPESGSVKKHPLEGWNPDKRDNNKLMKVNVKEGRKNADSQRFSCETFWKVYDFLKQDFVCFGYDAPEECKKEMCRPSL